MGDNLGINEEEGTSDAQRWTNGKRKKYGEKKWWNSYLGAGTTLTIFRGTLLNSRMYPAENLRGTPRGEEDGWSELSHSTSTGTDFGDVRSYRKEVSGKEKTEGKKREHRRNPCSAAGYAFVRVMAGS